MNSAICFLLIMMQTALSADFSILYKETIPILCAKKCRCNLRKNTTNLVNNTNNKKYSKKFHNHLESYMEFNGNKFNHLEIILALLF